MSFYNESDLEAGMLLKELHIFYLLDTSGSMKGEGIEQLNSGMRESLRIIKDKFETNTDAHLRFSVMTFNTTAQWISGTPDSRFSEYIEDFFDFPEQSADGLTHLGDALNLLEKGLSRRTMLESPTGNKRPIIIIMSDGEPTDDWQSALKSIQKNSWYRQAIKIGIALGSLAKKDVLAEVVGSQEAVLTITDTQKFANMLVILSVVSSLTGSKSKNAIEGDDYYDDAKEIVKEVKDQFTPSFPPLPAQPVTDTSAGEHEDDPFNLDPSGIE